MAIAVLLPDHAWQFWKFHHSTRFFWPHLAKLFKKGDIIAEAVVRLWIEEDIQFGANAERLLCTTVKTRLRTLGPRAKMLIAGYSEKNVQLTASASASGTNHRTIYIRKKAQFLFVQHIDDSVDNIHTDMAPYYPIGYWTSSYNRRKMLEQVICKLGGEKACLYELNSNALADSMLFCNFLISFNFSSHQLGAGVLWVYNHSYVGGVTSEFPEHWWKVWRFKYCPTKWWSNVAHLFLQDDVIGVAVVREYILELAEQHNISMKGDWIESFIQQEHELHSYVRKRLDYLGGLRFVLRRLFQDTCTFMSHQV